MRILQKIEKHPDNIAAIATEKFGITRQAVNKHLKKLVDEKALKCPRYARFLRISRTPSTLHSSKSRNP